MASLNELGDFLVDEAVIAPIEILGTNDVDHAVERGIIHHQSAENSLLGENALRGLSYGQSGIILNVFGHLWFGFSKRKRGRIIGDFVCGVSSINRSLPKLAIFIFAADKKKGSPLEVNPLESLFRLTARRLQGSSEAEDPWCDGGNYSSATTLTVMSAVMSVIRPIVIV